METSLQLAITFALLSIFFYLSGFIIFKDDRDEEEDPLWLQGVWVLGLCVGFMASIICTLVWVWS